MCAFISRSYLHFQPCEGRHNGEAGNASLSTSRFFFVVAVDLLVIFILIALGLQDIPCDGNNERHTGGYGEPRRAVKSGAVREGATNLRPLTPPQNGKIAYWMYQIYCTTGIQKW